MVGIFAWLQTTVQRTQMLMALTWRQEHNLWIKVLSDQRKQNTGHHWFIKCFVQSILGLISQAYLCTHGEHLADKQIIAEVTGNQHADDDTDQEEDEEDVEVTDEAIERPSAAAVNEALQILERLSLFSNDAHAVFNPLV